MHLAHDVVVRTQATNDLHICFRSLAAWLQGQRGRARWRTRIATPPTLRFARATLLGRMPGWCPTVHPVGPWRPVLRRLQGPGYMLRDVTARSAVKHGNGHLMLRCAFDGDVPGTSTRWLRLAAASATSNVIGPHEFAGDCGASRCRVMVAAHARHPATAPGDTASRRRALRYRACWLSRSNLDRGDDGRGFGLRINGEPIFCRGACWTTPKSGDAARRRSELPAVARGDARRWA